MFWRPPPLRLGRGSAKGPRRNTRSRSEGRLKPASRQAPPALRQALNCSGSTSQRSRASTRRPRPTGTVLGAGLLSGAGSCGLS